MTENLSLFQKKEADLKIQISENRTSAAKINSRLLTVAGGEEMSQLFQERLQLESTEQQLMKTISQVLATISDMRKDAEKKEEAVERERKEKLVAEVLANLPVCPKCGRNDLVQYLERIEPRGSTSLFWTLKTTNWCLPLSCTRPQCLIRWHYYPEEPEKNPTLEVEQ